MMIYNIDFRMIEKSKNIRTSKTKDQNMLLKSKKTLDKLSFKISEVAKKANKKSMIISSIEKETNAIKNSIENKIEGNFNKIINEQARVSIGMLIENKQNNFHETLDEEGGAYLLMKNYWKDKKKEITYCKKKQVYSKYNTKRQNKAKSLESDEGHPLISHKYTLNQVSSQKNKINKDERILAHLYTYMIPITDYKVHDDLPEFLLFQKNHYSQWIEIEDTLKSIENFCRFYEIKDCTVELQKVLQLIDKKKQVNMKKKSKVLYSPHELLTCLQNPEKISQENSRKSGIRFYGNKGKIRAIIRIQAVLKGKVVFNKCKKVKQMVTKTKKIQTAFRNHLFFLSAKQKIKESELKKVSWFNEKQQMFRQQYKIKQLAEKVKYEIHICCHSMNEWQRLSTLKYAEKQNAELTRIFRLAKESGTQIRIIYVSAFPISEEVLKYYFKIFQLGSAIDYQKKLFILAPQLYIYKKLPDTLSLTKILYYEPSTLNKIRKLIKGSYSYIVGSIPSMDYVPLCHYLDVPLYSGSPQTQLYIQTKSGTKELGEGMNRVEDKEFGVLPYCSDIYNVNSFINELALLIVKYSEINRWVLKIDNEINSRGIAYLDISRIIPRKLLVRMRKEQKKENIIKNYLEQVYRALDQNFVHKNKQILVIINKIYQSQAQFLTHFYINGGIIEASINNFEGQLENLCYCVEIEPHNEWKLLCSYYKITVKKQTIGCYYDKQMDAPSPQIQFLVKKIIEKKCFGFFTFQFSRIPSRYQSSDTLGIENKEKGLLYFNGLKCYLDQLSSAYFLKDFLAQNSNILYIPLIYHPNIKKIKMQTFFHLCRLQNISFDIEKKIGNVFMFLDSLESGCLGIMTFNHTSKVETYIHAAEVMDFFSSKLVQNEMNEDFLLIRNSINGFLNYTKRKIQKENKKVNE